MKDFNLHNKNLVDVVTLSLKQMGILDSITENREPTKLGRKQLQYDLQKKVWDYWHNNSTTSTLTSPPAKLRVSDCNKIQTGLEFIPSVTIVLQRRQEYFQSCWMTVKIPYKNLRGITHNDIEICCCKEHLHARWSVAALIECSEKNSINLEFNKYDNFFSYLIKGCQTLPTTHINQECTPSKKDCCPDIEKNRNDLKLRFFSLSNPDVNVKLTHFEKEEYTTKDGL